MPESAPARRHGPDCDCQRCRGFQPGNRLSVRHGAYAAPLELRGRIQELADWHRGLLGEDYRPEHEPNVMIAALHAFRSERAASALADAKPDELPSLDARLNSSLRGWLTSLGTLGLTRASAARIGADSRVGGELGRYLAEHYADGTRGEADA